MVVVVVTVVMVVVVPCGAGEIKRQRSSGSQLLHILPT